MSSSFIISSFILASFMVLISALGVSAPFAGLRPSGLSPPALSPVRERESEHKLKNTQGREGENGKTARGNTQITRGERSRGGEERPRGAWGRATQRAAARSESMCSKARGDPPRLVGQRDLYRTSSSCSATCPEAT